MDLSDRWLDHSLRIQCSTKNWEHTGISIVLDLLHIFQDIHIRFRDNKIHIRIVSHVLRIWVMAV